MRPTYFLLFSVIASPLLAFADPPPEKDLVLPGETFRLGENTAFILWPEASKRTSPQPWIFYAPTLPAYPDRHEKWMHQQFLDAGIAVAGIDVGEAYGSPLSHQYFDALYDHLTQDRNFATKPCLFGRSRGGLWVSSWAIAHPDRVAGIIGIYPVYDVRTYPGLDKAASAYGLTPEELAEQEPQLNPIHRIAELAQHDIPFAIIHGDQDDVVPLDANSRTVERIYKDANKPDLVEIIVVPNQGHNFYEGFFTSQPLVDFAIARAQQSVKPTDAVRDTPDE